MNRQSKVRGSLGWCLLTVAFVLASFNAVGSEVGRLAIDRKFAAAIKKQRARELRAPVDVPVPTPAPDPQMTFARDAIKLGAIYSLALAKDEDAQLSEAVGEQIAQESGTENVVVAPDVLRMRDEQGEVVDVKAFVGGGTLVFDPASRMYKGTVSVGVYPIPASPRKKLSVAVTFHVLDGALPGSASREVMETGPPYAEIPVSFSARANPQVVRVISPTSPEGMKVSLSQGPVVQLRIERKKIQGFGLETTRLDAFVTGVEPLQGRLVAFSGTPGSIESSTKEADSRITDAQGHASALLRSESTGPVTVTAFLPDASEAVETMEFEFPLRTLLASLIGGIVGGLIRLLPGRKISGPVLAKGMLVSVLVGAVVFGLYAVGVNVLPVAPTVSVGTVLVVVVSALGAFIGNIPLTAKPG